MQKIDKKYYIKKALEIAKEDRRKILNDLDIYLPIRKNKNPTLEDYRKSFKMLENGYDILKETEKLVKIERAMGDLNYLLTFN